MAKQLVIYDYDTKKTVNIDYRFVYALHYDHSRVVIIMIDGSKYTVDNNELKRQLMK